MMLAIQLLIPPLPIFICGVITIHEFKDRVIAPFGWFMMGGKRPNPQKMELGFMFHSSLSLSKISHPVKVDVMILNGCPFKFRLYAIFAAYIKIDRHCFFKLEVVGW